MNKPLTNSEIKSLRKGFYPTPYESRAVRAINRRKERVWNRKQRRIYGQWTYTPWEPDPKRPGWSVRRPKLIIHRDPVQKWGLYQ